METKEVLNDFTVIEFEPRYQDQIISLIGKTLIDQQIVPPGSPDPDDEDLTNIPEIYSGRGRFWLAVRSEQVVGTVAIRDLGDEVAKLNRMFVLSELHGTGIGQTLLDHALGFARGQGFKKIELDTHLLMKRAHRFYEKNGFKKIEDGTDKYFYSLELSGPSG